LLRHGCGGITEGNEPMPALGNNRAGIALVIGVGEYRRAERVETLRFAKRDAVAVADVLTDPSLCA